MATPSVSVVIPAYRAERTIRRAIDSVLAQTAPPSEIIVVDDGSPDGQAAIVRQYGLPVILLSQANRRTAAARNTGIDRAGGDLVAFLDADDYWEPHKLERQLAVFAAHSSVGLVASRHYNQDPDGNRSVNSLSHRFRYDHLQRAAGKAAFLLGTMLWTGTVIVRRELLTKERFVSGLEPAEDRDLWIRLASQTPVYLLSQPLATAVLEPGGISRCDIARDCTQMLKVVQRHRHMLGLCASLVWRSYIRYRWAAIETAPRVALPLLARSLFGWPAPLLGMPAMQSWGRLRRLVVLLTELLAGSPRSSTVRATP